MTTSAFPGALDTISPVPADPENAALGDTGPYHDEHHQELSDAIEATQAHVGKTGSTDPASIEYRLSSVITAAGDAADAAAAAAVDAAAADAKGAAAQLGLSDLIADLGTAAYLNAGAGVGNLVQLAVAGQLPALDGSLLTGLAPGGVTDYADLTGKPTLGTAAATDATDYAPAAKGVTNGDTHDHNGGDGAQIAYASLSGTPTLGTAAAANTTAFEASGAVSTHAALTTSHGISSFGATLVDDPDAATARTTLGLGTAATTAGTAYATSTQGANADAHLAASAPHSGHSTPASVATLISTHNSDGAAHPSLAPTTTTIGALINGATSKTTPVDADQIGLMDSAASNVLKKLSWSNIKTALGSAFVQLSGGAGTQNLLGKLGIGISPTATLHLKAGTAAATTGPLKFTAGTLVTTPEAGLLEFDSAGPTYTTSAAVRRRFASEDFVQASSLSLITNGFGMLGDNTGFSAYTFDATDVPVGGGSFRVNASQALRTSDVFMPVDTSIRYNLSLYAKSGDISGANYNAANRQYFGLVEYDIDKNTITSEHSEKSTTCMPAVDTTLAAQLNPGDMTMTLTDATGWYNGAVAAHRNFCWYPYTNSFGYTYPDWTYTRNLTYFTSGNAVAGCWAQSGISGNVIALRVAWPGPTLPAGTKVRNNGSGSSYKYIMASNQIVPNAWTKYSGFIEGLMSVSGAADINKFKHGTAFIRVLHLVNYHGAADNNVRLGGITVTTAASANLEPNFGIGATYKALSQSGLPTNGLAVEGDSGFGISSPSARGHFVKTTEQLRIGYDATNYQSTTVSASGVPTWTSTGGAFAFQGDIRLDKTITAGGTTGARTINNTLGSVNFAAGASSLVVTNSRVTTSSIIIATVATADATMKSVVAVAAAGSFTLTANAAATAETRVNFTVLN